MTMLLGIDLGTSSVKTALIEAGTNRHIASASQEYPVLHPQAGYAEQHPEDWWGAVVDTVQKVVHEGGKDVAGIAICGQMHGFACIGKDGELVRPAIIWADTRSVAEVDSLTDQIRKHPDKFSGINGLPAAGFMSVTLMWLAQHEPETLGKTHQVILPKDYIRYRMTGTLASDYSDASATGLFDVATNTWSGTMLDTCGIDAAIMPELLQSAEVAGTLRRDVAEILGLQAGIPVVAGSADLPSQALGFGLIHPGMGMVTVGTGGQVVTPLVKPEVDPDYRYYVFTHSAPDRWYAQAAILSAGLSLRWLRDTLNMTADPVAYPRLSALASDVPAGADGLLFLPYLAGERTPLMNPSASGMFFGLRLHHSTGHLARSVMEGVAFALKSCLQLVAGDAEQVILSGGAGNSAVWRQILADVFDVPLLLADSAPHSCIGLSLLAGIGAGIYADMDEATSGLRLPEQVIEPDREQVARYQTRYEQFLRLYPLLKDEMAWLIQQG